MTLNPNGMSNYKMERQLQKKHFRRMWFARDSSQPPEESGAPPSPTHHSPLSLLLMNNRAIEFGVRLRSESKKSQSFISIANSFIVIAITLLVLSLIAVLKARRTLQT